MANERLAQIEHTSQLLIFQIKNVNKLIAKAWYELEVARSDLRDLIAFHEEWEKEQGFNQEQKG